MLNCRVKNTSYLICQCLHRHSEFAINSNDSQIDTMAKHKCMSTSDRKACYYMLLSFCQDRVPKRGAWANVAALFSVDPRMVARLWKDMRTRIENSDNEDPIDDDRDQQQCCISWTKAKDCQKRHLNLEQPLEKKASSFMAEKNLR